MIKYFLFLVLLGGVVSGELNGQRANHPDTIRTLAIYKTNALVYDVVFRVGYDSLYFVDVDSVTKKKQMGRWLDYYYPVPKVKMDSTGKPAVDKAGKNIYYTSYDPLPKENLIKDFNINIDSLVKIHSPQK